MARKGTPIPWSLRTQLRDLEYEGHSRCEIQRMAGVSDKTIRKYLGPKFPKNRSQEAT